MFCREVLSTPGYIVPVFICTWHATKTWIEQIRCKLIDKSLFTDAFNGLHDIMTMDPGGTREERLAAVDSAIGGWQEQFKDETELLKWFNRYWEPKKGVLHVLTPVKHRLLCACNVLCAACQ